MLSIRILLLLQKERWLVRRRGGSIQEERWLNDRRRGGSMAGGEVAQWQEERWLNARRRGVSMVAHLTANQ
jgi:hypothetical protein